jgi:hypothetical protein
MAVNAAMAAGVRLRAIEKPAGIRNRPMAAQKAGNVSSPGRTANLMIAAKRMLPAEPSVKAMAPP